MAAPKGKRNGNYKHGLSEHPLYICFNEAMQRCTNPNNPAYKWYKGRWGNNTVAELTLHYLKEYERFVKNNPGVTPSIDRISEDGKYEIGNVQIIGREENTKKYQSIKGHPQQGKFGKNHHNSIPVEGFMDGSWVRFFAAIEAMRKTGVNQGDIIKACKGKRKTAGGYRWRYATIKK